MHFTVFRNCASIQCCRATSESYTANNLSFTVLLTLASIPRCKARSQDQATNKLFSVLLRLASILWCRATSDDYAENNLSLRMEPEGEVRPILCDVQLLNAQGHLRYAASLFMLSAPGVSSMADAQ